MIVTAGSTNKSVYYYIVQDASGTSPGEPVTGLLFSDIETGGSASYARQGAARVDLTLITLASASAIHADGGFILVDDTNMPGLYRCDYPDAAFVTGVDQVFCQIVVASAKNAVAAPILVDITDVDLRDSVRGGMTALPNAAADAAGGLAISDAGGLDLDTKLANTNEITVARMGVLTDWINGNRLDLILDARMAEASINTTAGAVDNVTLVATTTTNADMVAEAPTAVQNRQEMDSNSADLDAIQSNQTTINTNVLAIPTNPNTVVPDAAGTAPTAVENRQEMDSSSVDLNSILSNIAALNDISVSDIQTTQMTESYAANGVAPTQAQALFAIHQMLMEFVISGTSFTVKKLDSSTTAFVVTLDDATNPTSATR